MDDSRRSPSNLAPRRPPARRRHWQAFVAVLLAVVAVGGHPATASQATDVARARSTVPASATAALVAARPADGHDDAARAAAPDRPDLQVAFGPLDDVRAGQPFRATLQVRNDGVGGAASVTALVPPEVSNVRVTAPGFVCTRHFTASGAQAGTEVACSRNDLDQGAAASVTIDANAPSGPGRYLLTAAADPRGDVDESDEANNRADLSVDVHG